MKKELSITVDPARRQDVARHREALSRRLGVSLERIQHAQLLRASLDSRRGQPKYQLLYRVWIDEGYVPESVFSLALQNVASAPPVCVIGCGPAGLFSALRLIELGYRPLVLERGKAVRERRHDIAALTKRGIVDGNSNYCFGEGGAGTFSDGKLYTRSTKRGCVSRILDILVAHGAAPDIRIDAHPHIGTNKLPRVIQSICSTIRDCGGDVIFHSRVEDLQTSGGQVVAVRTADGQNYPCVATVLASGHSARDIFWMLQRRGCTLQYKPFALGVRIEHPQELIDSRQYHSCSRSPFLPPAAYQLRTQQHGRGVYSFCMCPGGIICPASTDPAGLVVNGWSPSKRNSRFANSGLVVEVQEQDLKQFERDGPLRGVAFQDSVERRAADAGGGKQKAPGQRVSDFLAGVASSSVPDCSYLPGVTPTDLWDVLPSAFCEALHEALKVFDRQLRGYASSEGLMVAVESRTSSPVRIMRNPETLMHDACAGLFPCGEGAGYAGGIVSAAIDGERVAEAVAAWLGQR